MTILNRHKVPAIEHAALNQYPKINWVNIDTQHWYRYSWIRNYDDKDYWFIEFSNTYSFKFCLAKLIPLDIIQRIQNKEVVLVLCNAQHGYHRIIEDLYIYAVIKHSIPPEQILLLSNSPDILTEISAISNKHSLGQIKVEFMIEFEAEAKVITESQTIAKNTLVHKNYSKKFLSFNGLPRPHRTATMLLLKINNLLDSGYISYNVRLKNSPTQDPEYWYNQLLVREDLALFFTNYKENICGLEPIYLDTTCDTHHLLHPAEVPSSHISMYENSYFSLITETAAYKDFSDDGTTGSGRILSEKTFKAIINHHPFILVALPRSLELLHELGYKTFSPWINESYDSEVDDLKRTLMIGDEVKRLCNLSESGLQEFLTFTKQVVEHNYNNLINKTKWVYPLN